MLDSLIAKLGVASPSTDLQTFGFPAYPPSVQESAAFARGATGLGAFTPTAGSALATRPGSGSCPLLTKFQQIVARFRLYRHRFFQLNMRFAAFFEIYQIFKLIFLKFGKIWQILRHNDLQKFC